MGWKGPPHSRDAVPSPWGCKGTLPGGCREKSVLALFEPGTGGDETVPGRDRFRFRARAPDRQPRRTGEGETTIRGSSPWIAGVRGVGMRWFANLGSSQRSPHMRSSRAAGARPRPISVSE